MPGWAFPLTSFGVQHQETLTEIDPTPRTPPAPKREWLTVVGLVLLPVAAILLLFELYVGLALAWGILFRHPEWWEAQYSKWWFLYPLCLGLIGPAAIAFIWFGPFDTQMENRSRLALVGFVGAAVAGLAGLLLLGEVATKRP